MASTPAETQQIVWGVTLMRYVSGVGMMLVFYDWLLTLNDEMTLVWPGTFSLPKALYYINRYTSIIIIVCANYVTAGFRPPLSTQLFVCRIFGNVSGICSGFRTFVGTAILTLRLAALYRGARWVVWSLWVIFTICTSIRLVLAIIGTAVIAGSFVYSTTSGQCLPTRKGYLWFGALGTASSMLLDIVILVLTVLKARATFSSSLHSSLIMRELLRDELLYFLVIVSTRVFQTIALYAFPAALHTVFGYLTWGLEATVIARFFLNLRAIYHQPQYTTGSQTAPSTLTPSHKLSFWRRSTKTETTGVEVETRIDGSAAVQSERDISQGGTHDLGSAMELQTRHDGDERVVTLAADFPPKDETEPFSQS